MEINVEPLQKTVEQMHSCSAVCVGSEAIFETFEGETAWEGVVHVFELDGHPKATRAYAWSSPVEGSVKRRFFAVLHIPPVTSAVEAVRAAIVAEFKVSEADDAKAT